MRFHSVHLAYFHDANALSGCGRLVHGHGSNSYIVIRDKDKIAHSRGFSVKEIKWNNEKSCLEMVAVKVRLKRVPMFILRFWWSAIMTGYHSLNGQVEYGRALETTKKVQISRAENVTSLN
jgi:hypothetical protein